MDAALGAKQQAPLEPRKLGPAATTAIDAHHALCRNIADLSARLIRSNAELGVVKEQAQAANVGALQGDLVVLRATQARYSPAVAPLCQAYLDEKQAKAATEARRNRARADLDNYRQNVFPQYQTAINIHV